MKCVLAKLGWAMPIPSKVSSAVGNRMSAIFNGVQTGVFMVGGPQTGACPTLPR